GKIDWQKLQATLGEAVDLGERYGLGWKGKSDVFTTIQEKTVQTLHLDRANSVDWDTTGNMFIEGDNLATLKILHKAYYGKVKMIYIDPPYNTGNDFIYNDDFKQTRRSYETEAGITDDEGNVVRDDGLRTNTGGHKHSNWLNMMHPRLFLARNLLRQDGVIFVSIDDNEVHNLRLMMNEIFGEENFVAQIVWERAYAPVNLKHHFSESHDYIVCFARNIDLLDKLSLKRNEAADARYKNPDNDPRGIWQSDNFSVGPANQKNIYEIVTPSGRKILPPSGRSWLFSQERTNELIADNRVWFGDNGSGVPRYKRFLSEVKDGVTPMTVWKYTDVGHSQDATKEVKDLFDGVAYFDYPKPVKLIKQLASLCTDGNDIILDFFSGSGTTAHAVAELNAEDGGNRRWICVQLPELTDEKSEAYKAGYRTIADIARERIRRAGAKIQADQADKLASRSVPLDLGFRAYRVGDSNFKQWNELASNPEEIRQQALANLDPLEEGTTDDDLLAELLLKRGISPLAQVERHDNFCFIPSERLAICLAHSMTEELFATILAAKPSSIIILDRAFGDDINLKVNLLLQAERQGVEVEVV
ncbi:MAG: site-specific DNA-methyltransferase, partial [Candidatus Nanosynbacter sp. P2B_S1_bin.0.1]|nr:site-specific DNA-methyltransferase [Candidatus Nanosynbacter sp. P2B_S1_bin.0.1]